MIAAWMLYCTAIGLVLSVAGVALERSLHLAGRPTRWAWAIATLATLLIPIAAWLRPEAFRTLAIPLPPAIAEPARVVAPRAADLAPLVTAAAPSFSLRDLDAALAWGWGTLSVLALCAVGAAARRLAKQRRRWRTSLLDGTPVLVSESVGPAVTGVWRPAVVVPAWTLAIGETYRRLMLSHEQEHVRAADPLLLAIGTSALVLMPWNPALWWQVRRLRLAVEIDCDARVLARGGTAPQYGELLLQVGRRRSRIALMAAGLHEPISFLEHRIRRLATRLPRWRWLGAAGAVVVAAGAIVAACETPRPVNPDGDQAFATRGATQFLDATPGQAAALVRDLFPQLLRGRDEPVYVWLVFDAQGRVVSKGTAPRSLAARGISTEQGPQLIPGYDTLRAHYAQEYGVLGYGVLAPNSPPVMYVRLRPVEESGADPAPTRVRDDRPTLLTGPVLQYPNVLRHAGIQGRVIVEAVVDTTGRAEPSSVKIIASTHPGFVQSASTWVMRARFRPAHVQGRAVRARITLPIDFRETDEIR